ncbi:hypothetical protein AZI87_12115 [Bdellovibrio bacteriovorus]|uniref:Esterase n=1 Tax=Bdellovibrio bacteriovorus TaxID=959 RepID=A0A162G8R0_BDEBC|nr:alpha/beta hydrolase [Bdellovibrio bacteriovorus]KYG65294.1 hypothetical protein AZI87_12115 [Bdellovibrio bacteriovorus]
MKSVSVFLLLLYVSVTSWAQSEEEIQNEIEIESFNYQCGTDSARGIEFKYCYRKSSATNNDDIVYFFHGLYGSEKSWHRQFWGTWFIQKWWYFRGYQPRVVSISFGPKWLLVNNKKYPLLPLFTQEIMPMMEKRMGGLRRGKRHVIGQSMGGFNATQIALRNPGMFSRVALLCPAITHIGPYDSEKDIHKYVARTGAKLRLVKKMLNISRSIFLNKQDWDLHNPFNLLKKYNSSKRAKFYLSTGMIDGYGFQEGSKDFYDMAHGKSFLSRWVPVPGGHCNFNRKNTAYFIMGD